MDRNKSTAIQEKNHPKYVKAVQIFLRICGHYRKHIKDFSIVSLPLRKMTRKNEGFEWKEARK